MEISLNKFTIYEFAEVSKNMILFANTISSFALC